MHAPRKQGARARRFGREAARRFYDRFGARQDAQAWYEDPALHRLIHHGAFGAARAVLEPGCGTGRLAARLLAHHLPAGARYRALDISATMVDLARQRLRPWAPRAGVELWDGEPPLPVDAGWADRFVSTYLLDLLPEPDIAALLDEAHRALAPGGRLCTAGLCPGRGASRAVATLWSLVHRVNPRWVGGCRPLWVLDRLPAARWRVLHHGTVVAWGIPSEVLVAERL